MKIITTASQKGGTGKTTTALALASFLTEKGKAVLLVDLDTQGNLSDTLNLEPEASISQVIDGKIAPEKAAIETGIGKAIASDVNLSKTNKMKSYIPFDKVLYSFSKKVDYVILDTPPSLSLITISAIQSADYIIVPVLADRYSETAAIQLHEILETTKGELLAFIVTRWNGRSIINREGLKAIEDLAEEYGTKVYTVREAVAVREAQYTGEPNLFEYASKSNAAIDYKNIFEEITKNI